MLVVVCVFVAVVIVGVMWSRSRRMGTEHKPVVNVMREPSPNLRLRSARKGEHL